MEKTHWKKAFKSDYLSSSDVDGGDLKATINYVRLEECMTQSGKTLCNVAHFKESIKPMILNVTNSKIVKKFANNATHLEDWNNIPVSIYVDSNVRFGRETVEGLRIRVNNQSAPIKRKKTITKEQVSELAKYMNESGKNLSDMKKVYEISAEIEKLIENAQI